MSIIKNKKLNKKNTKNELSKIIEACFLGKRLGLNTLAELKEFLKANKKPNETINEALRKAYRNILTEDSRYPSKEMMEDPFDAYTNALEWAHYSTNNFKMNVNDEYRNALEAAELKAEENNTELTPEEKKAILKKAIQKVKKSHLGWWYAADKYEKDGATVSVAAFSEDKLQKAIDIAKDLGMKVFPVYKVQSKPNAVPIYVVEVDTEIDTDTEEYKKTFIKYIPDAQRKAYSTKSWNVEDTEESEELEDVDSDSQE